MTEDFKASFKRTTCKRCGNFLGESTELHDYCKRCQKKIKKEKKK